MLSVATLLPRGYLTELILEQLSYFIRKECLNDQLTIGGDLVLHNLELKLDVLRETLGVPLISIYLVASSKVMYQCHGQTFLGSR